MSLDFYPDYSSKSMSDYSMINISCSENSEFPKFQLFALETSKTEFTFVPDNLSLKSDILFPIEPNETRISENPLPINIPSKPRPKPKKHTVSVKYRNGGRQIGKGIIQEIYNQIDANASRLHFIVKKEIKKSYQKLALTPGSSNNIFSSCLRHISLIASKFRGKNKLQSLKHFRTFWGAEGHSETDKTKAIAYLCLRAFSRYWLKNHAENYLIRSNCKKNNLEEMLKLIPKFIAGLKNPSEFKKLK